MKLNKLKGNMIKKLIEINQIKLNRNKFNNMKLKKSLHLWSISRIIARKNTDY